MIAAEHLEVVADFAAFGVHAFTTTRHVGTFAADSDEPARDVLGRWDAIRALARDRDVHRFVTGPQVHGADVLVHTPAWQGWLRAAPADGHLSAQRGTAIGVTVADCVPILIAHPSGAVAALHAGWRGTAAGILERGIDAFARAEFAAPDLHMHLGPAICGRCYEVGPEVVAALAGGSREGRAHVDLRAIIAARARALGVRHVTLSSRCTRCNNDRFYSHRAGDRGRQLAVILAQS